MWGLIRGWDSPLLDKSCHIYLKEMHLSMDTCSKPSNGSALTFEPEWKELLPDQRKTLSHQAVRRERRTLFLKTDKTFDHRLGLIYFCLFLMHFSICFVFIVFNNNKKSHTLYSTHEPSRLVDEMFACWAHRRGCQKYIEIDFFGGGLKKEKKIKCLKNV